MTVKFFDQPYLLYASEISFTGRPYYLHIVERKKWVWKKAIVILGWNH